MKAIDRYQPLEVLGRGGFGTVFRARHVHTGEFVALKVLEAPAAEIGHRVLREARALAGLVHPNVVRVLDCGITDTGEIFVAMELAHGVELAKLLEMGTGPLPMQRAIGIAQQILFGLSAVHARGIVHRDVKPSNIVVATDVRADGAIRDFVRLIDFGISKLTTGETAMLDRTRPGMSMGTPGYMAPEQLGSAHAADARADLYAVAVILYEMLSGMLPHRAPSYEDYVVAVRTTPPPPLTSVAPYIPHSLAATIMHGLERDPRARFSSAQEFGAALEACANDVAAVSAAATVRAAAEHAPLLTRPPNTSGGPTPPPTAQPTLITAAKPTSPWPWVGLGAALLLAIAGGSLAVWLATPATREATSTSTSAAAKPTAEAPTSTAAKPTAETPTSTAAKPTAETPTSKASASLPVPVPALSASARAPSASPSRCGKGGALPVVIASAQGVKVGPGRVVGEAEASWVDAVARHGAASVGVCRPECGSELVTVHLFLQASGQIGLVGPSPDNTGDPSAARCVADRMKTGAPKHDPKLASSPTGGPHGIVTYAVLLDRK